MCFLIEEETCSVKRTRMNSLQETSLPATPKFIRLGHVLLYIVRQAASHRLDFPFSAGNFYASASTPFRWTLENQRHLYELGCFFAKLCRGNFGLSKQTTVSRITKSVPRSENRRLQVQIRGSLRTNTMHSHAFVSIRLLCPAKRTITKG